MNSLLRRPESEVPKPFRIFIGFFRWTAVAIFAFGLLFVIMPSIIHTKDSDKVWPLLGFLAGWLFVFGLIFRGLSLKRSPEPRTGMVFVYNLAQQSRLFGLGFVAISWIVGWFVLIEPLVNRTTAFEWTSLVFFAILLLFLVIGGAALLQVKVIRLDAGSGQYVFRTGYFPFCKEQRGDFADFSALHIRREVANTGEDGSPMYAWRLKLAWKVEGREELQLDQRPRGLADLATDPVIELSKIGADISAKTGIPLQKHVADPDSTLLNRSPRGAHVP